MLEPRLDFSDKPFESLGAESEFFRHAFRAQGRPDEALEQQSCVLVGLHGQPVLSGHYDALLKQFSDALNDFEGRKVGRHPLVYVEDLLHVPDHPLKVARQDDVGVAVGENLPQRLPIFLELLPFQFEFGDHLSRSHQLFYHVFVEHPSQVSLVARVEPVFFLERLKIAYGENSRNRSSINAVTHPVAQFDGGQVLKLDHLSAQSVFAVTKLDQLSH